ncbi:hypothetical protein K491DRAFT_37240 [Lophiostoma macrostomum CBS 122681]|uniref:SprT-like domain-containing protein n=1 Tax=Lophiostoma macrostomum CBS 122681 TaxID=1314788 RepID=A0A6A6TL85_9PLEO|nr:hypothetical protein K491DRAFT_37240 [Lophiostoma macrostomum CBS 122681]
MARLRKPSSPSEPAIPFLPPPSASSSKPRGTRSSPRKAQITRETPSTRELRYTSLDNDDSSFLIPKLPSGDTPRKQRVLRPVASNSRLLRKLSNESLASPEKERLRSREQGLGYSYSKQLARTIAGRKIGNRAEEKRQERRPQGLDYTLEKKIKVSLQESVPQSLQPEETPLDENEDADQSLCCGDEEEPAVQESGLVEPEAPIEELQSESEDEDDEDPIVQSTTRRRGMHARAIQIESDEEDEIPEEAASMNIHEHRATLRTETVREEPAIERPPVLASRPAHRKGKSTISNWAQEVIDLTSSPPLRPIMSSPHDNEGAMLHFSPTPTKQRSPRKAPPIPRPSTPPLPPASPSKLVSPSKKKNRIPQAPDLRPSLDAFWAPEVVNTWNDKHSPSKPLVSPRKQKWLKELNLVDDSSDSDTSFPSPTASPRKKATVPPSPTKKASPTVTQIRAQRKAFSASKHSIAESFLAEVDNTITGGRIASMSASTGGIKLVWSKTLKTTAGRANWRREQIRMRMGPQPTDIRVEYRHHCSIELAEKVIDDEERLYNVLAHEYCHLTTFMISDVRNNPHGAEFKSWAAKVSKAFASKGVEVTTKHSYQIAYKYVWECIACGYEFKRHSKSVDPVRHSCGRCKGKLVQTKPTPRTTGKDGAKRERSEYQIFVKANFSRVKKELEARGLDCAMGRVMEAVAKEYREKKEMDKEKGGVVQVEELFEGLKIEDENV